MKLDATSPPRVTLLTRPCQTGEETSRWLCRHLNLPYERGPFDFKSMAETNQPGFIKFNPQAHPPADTAPMAPLRDPVQLTEPTSGLLSAGARTDLSLPDKYRFIERVYARSDLWAPAAARNRPQTPTGRPSNDLSDYKRWNSRIKSESAKQASLQGQTDVDGTEPSITKTPWSVKFSGRVDNPPSQRKDARSSVLSEFIDTAARRYIYTSMAQRGYEDVDWDSKLPHRLKPPMTTLEKMADPVDQHFTLKRYHGKPEVWQAIGPHWNKHQLRPSYNVKKPIDFTSPCLKSGQIPLYSGVVGSENMDNVDNPEQDFRPLTVLRTVLPPYTPTAHRFTIPGYTGRALHNRPHTSAIIPQSSPFTPPATGSSFPPSAYGRRAPLSRMVTTVPPSNPYLYSKASARPI